MVAGVSMMIGRGDQRTVRFEEQVIPSPRIATDAVNGLLIVPDGAQPIQDLLIQPRDVPLQRVFVRDREVLEAANLADRECSLVQGTQHHATAFCIQVASDVEVAHLPDAGRNYCALSLAD